MHVALRPYMTAGVALAGATAIAVSSVSPALSEIAAPVTHAANVELTSIQDGIDAYRQLFEDTTGSLVDLFDQAVIDNGPAPILQAIIANQLRAAAGVANGFEDSVQNFLQTIANLPTLIEVATDLLASGNVLGATSLVVGALNSGLLGSVLPVTDAFIDALLIPINNVADAVTALGAAGLFVAGQALLGPPNALVFSGAAAIQGVIDAVRSGDIGDLIGAFVAAPAVITDGVLNGFGPAGGVFSSSGPIGALLQIRNIIANAISPASDVTPFSAGPESVPTKGKVFALSTSGGSASVVDEDGPDQAGATDVIADDATDVIADDATTSGHDATAGEDITGDDDTGADDVTAGDDAVNDATGADDTDATEDVTGDDTEANDVIGDDTTDADAGTDDTTDADAGKDNTGPTENTGGTDTSNGTDNPGNGTTTD